MSDSPACAYAAQQCQRDEDSDEVTMSDIALLARCKQAILQCAVDTSNLANVNDIQTCMNVAQLSLCGDQQRGTAKKACYDLGAIPTTGASNDQTVRYWTAKGGVTIDGDAHDTVAVTCRACVDQNPDAETIYNVANGMGLNATMCCDEGSLKNMISQAPEYCDVIIKNATMTCGLENAVNICKNEEIAALCNWKNKNSHEVYMECADEIPKQFFDDVWDSEGVPWGWYAAAIGTAGSGIGYGIARGGRRAAAEGARKARGVKDDLTAYNQRNEAARVAQLAASAERGRETIPLLAGGEQPGYGSDQQTERFPVESVLAGGRDPTMDGAFEMQDFNAAVESTNPVHNWADDDGYPDDYDITRE